MKREVLVLVILSFAFVNTVQGQTFIDAYNDFKQQAQNNYEDFRRKANLKYAEWMRKAWKWY